MQGKIVNPEGFKENLQARLFEYLNINGVKFETPNSFHCFSKSHEDKNASAGLTENKRGFKCHGCGISGDILTACNIIEGRGITGKEYYDTLKYLADKLNVPYQLENTSVKKEKTNKQKVAEYLYFNPEGKILFKTIRFEWVEEGKKHKEIKPYTLKNGKWSLGYKGIERILYKLPDVKEAIENKDIVFFVEGEKCVDILNSLGLNATSIPGGSNAWNKPHTKNYITQLAGARLVVLPDKDESGMKLAKQVAEDVKPVAESVKVIDLNDDINLPPKGDIEQWLQLGGSKERLLDLVDKTSEWKENDVANSKTVTWYETTKSGRVKVNTGLLARHLIESTPAIYVSDSFYIYENGVYKDYNNAVVSSIIKDCIDDKYCSMSVINDTQGLWARDKDVLKNVEHLNKNPNSINVKNGLLDVITGELMPHTPKSLSTIQLNVNYNPKAKGDEFMKFINSVLPDSKDRMLVQELTGYLFSVYTQAKKFFVLIGPTNSGKSTFLNSIQKIITENYLAHIPMQNLSDRFNKAELFGKLANIVNELPDTPITDVGFLKSLVGQDPIQGERKGRDPFNFTSKTKHVFACNNLPSNYGDSTDAFYKKLIIIPFNNQIPDNEIDPLLPKKLEKEYIFAWGIEGLKRLIRNDFKFTENSATKEIIDAHKIASNPILYFVKEECIVGNYYHIGSNYLYREYQEFCRNHGLKPVSSIRFGSTLKAHFGDAITKGQVGRKRLRAFIGITLKNDKKILPNINTKKLVINLP